MSPLSWPVLGGAALLSSPVLYRAFVEGTTTAEVALTRFLVTLVVWWAVLAFVAMIVGPTPRPQSAEESLAEQPETAPSV